MFGFSIQKLLVLASIIGAVWYGFKLVGRLDQARRAGGQARGGAQGGTRGERGFADGVRRWASRMQHGSQPGGGGETEDMVKCSVCGAYVAVRSASSCGRGDCPY